MSLLGATMDSPDSLLNVAWQRVSITCSRRQLQANIFDNNGTVLDISRLDGDGNREECRDSSAADQITL
jgi:hypothetical protein